MDVVTAQGSFWQQRSSAMRPGGRAFQTLHQNYVLCNICFMTQPQSKSSPLSEFCSALPSLPTRLQQVGRFVAANDYDATTRSMRDLAAEAGRRSSFLHASCESAGLFRLGRIARCADRGAPARAILSHSRPGPAAARKGPNAEISLVADKLEAEAAGLGAHLQHLRGRRRQGLARGAADLDRRLSQLPQRCGIAQLSASIVPARRGATGRRLRSRRSRPRRLPARRRCRGRRLCALFHGQRAVGARGASIPARRWSRLPTRSPRRWPKAPIICCSIEAASSPGFFPSLTGAIAIAQSLAAVTFVLGGAAAKRRLEETEGRLAAMSQYVAEKG